MVAVWTYKIWGPGVSVTGTFAIDPVGPVGLYSLSLLPTVAFRFHQVFGKFESWLNTSHSQLLSLSLWAHFLVLTALLLGEGANVGEWWYKVEHRLKRKSESEFPFNGTASAYNEIKMTTLRCKHSTQNMTGQIICRKKNHKNLCCAGEYQRMWIILLLGISYCVMWLRKKNKTVRETMRQLLKRGSQRTSESALFPCMLFNKSLLHFLLKFQYWLLGFCYIHCQFIHYSDSLCISSLLTDFLWRARRQLCSLGSSQGISLCSPWAPNF